MFAPKEILVPTDFSELSDNALRYGCDVAQQHACDVAQQGGSSIHLFHVVEVIQQCAGDYCLDGVLVADIQAKIMESAQELIKKQITRVVKAEDGKVITVVRQGVPYAEILKELDDLKIDLVVMASHGKTGILSHFGSVTDKVMRGAKCPVLVVKGY
jgi:nucleotide-binding universal stress UspA family protein